MTSESMQCVPCVAIKGRIELRRQNVQSPSWIRATPEAELGVKAADWESYAAAIALAHCYFKPICL